MDYSAMILVSFRLIVDEVVDSPANYHGYRCVIYYLWYHTLAVKRFVDVEGVCS